MEAIDAESADALRYWATSSRTGADSPYAQDTVDTGRRLVTKLWNAGRLAEACLSDFTPGALPPRLFLTDQWLLARLNQTTDRATAALEAYDFAAARAEVERFFWQDFCDNYLELAKARLYGADEAERQAAEWTLYQALLSVLKLLAPYLPYITEALFQGIYRAREGAPSLHQTRWPERLPDLPTTQMDAIGTALLEVLSQTRRAKAEHKLSVGAELAALRIAASASDAALLTAALTDLRSATRARRIQIDVRADQQQAPGDAQRDSRGAGGEMGGVSDLVVSVETL